MADGAAHVGLQVREGRVELLARGLAAGAEVLVHQTFVALHRDARPPEHLPQRGLQRVPADEGVTRAHI